MIPPQPRSLIHRHQRVRRTYPIVPTLITVAILSAVGIAAYYIIASRSFIADHDHPQASPVSRHHDEPKLTPVPTRKPETRRENPPPRETIIPAVDHEYPPHDTDPEPVRPAEPPKRSPVETLPSDVDVFNGLIERAKALCAKNASPRDFTDEDGALWGPAIDSVYGRTAEVYVRTTRLRFVAEMRETERAVRAFGSRGNAWSENTVTQYINLHWTKVGMELTLRRGMRWE